eukprot:TRINITY_DN3580_c0_g1_i1.p1 TRINITY_DN3580_c0_g1~~TRINITY_DN3580_c0_g1_i1.p1  ORF type:complete len:184 (+),score=56.39 TRINITY_DN3580_c0_g1_i1:61-552(+)
MSYNLDQRTALANKVLELYNLRPSEDVYSNFKETARFQDPLAKAITLGELKSQFNALPSLFKQANVLESKINPNYGENLISVDMKVRYVPKLIGKEIMMDSQLLINVDSDNKVTSMEEKWNHQETTKEEDGTWGKFLQSLRRGQAKLTHALVSETPKSTNSSN